MKNTYWTQDIWASVVVFLVALPLCMGIAMASGLSPAAGIISGIVGGILVGLFSGCPLQVSGPAAGLVAVVWGAVQTYGVESLGIILILAGVMQACFGFLRLASWFRAFSPAVIQGGLSGLGVLIASSQFHVMLDTQPEGQGLANLAKIPDTMLKGIFPLDGSTHHLAALIGIVTILTMALWVGAVPKQWQKVPAPLVAVLVAVMVSAGLHLPIQYIVIPDNPLAVLKPPTLEQVNLLANSGIWGAAFVIAFVATIETVLTMIAIERLRPGVHADFDQEMKAQGLGNLVCGVLGALPIAGVIIRSAANIETGAQTRLSAILHGVWMLIPIAFLPFLLEHIPTATLAALLVYTGMRLINLQSLKVIAGYGRSEVAIYGITLVSTVIFNLMTGILVGAALSAIKILYQLTHLQVHQVSDAQEGVFHLYLAGSATFIRLPVLIKALLSLPRGQSITLHLDQLQHIDPACLEYLMGWEKQYLQSGGNVSLAGNDSLTQYVESRR